MLKATLRTDVYINIKKNPKALFKTGGGQEFLLWKGVF